ncbi:hypothetical protein BTE48_06320 [Oceanospirillum multiglobuliferum]|uniref:Sulfatase N-terminal domain-containing protein n=1 Tax=Oceanospirillum multiglobuliferum TaxID=64969 RepID=A0A1V4T6X4_9GAMM|nr:hypothetical protein BTE48_06320 [Oceanospirillum multiglobuliferum]
MTVYLVASRYLPFIQVSEVHSISYLIMAYIGHFGLLPVVFWIGMLPLALILPSRWLLLPISLIVLFGGLFLLAVDTTIYSQYRFHLSGFVWELITAPEASDMFQLSWFTILVIVFVLVGVFIAALGALSMAVWLVKRKLSWWCGITAFSIWIFSLLISQVMHIWYEAHYDAEVTGITRHFPSYYPVTAKTYLLDNGLIDPTQVRQEVDLSVSNKGQSLRYPQNPMQCVTPEKPKNVLVIGIDAMRADVFTPEVTPNLYALTEKPNAQQFMNHHSGGNVTKGGIFSLFFGLPATYWDGFAAAQEGAVWIKQQQAAEYQMGIFGSATLVSPAFDRTVFASIPNLRVTTEGTTPSGKDLQVIKEFEQFLSEKNDEKPFFGFLFMDAAHSYDVPTGYDKFKPQWSRVDHVKLNNDFDPVPYFNRYKNALHFLDQKLGEMLARLEAQGELDNTVVILTSDHGEEFNDLKQNFWGHGSNFTHYQTQVPLLILWPGKSQQKINYKTSHFDLAPTILQEILGCQNPTSDYAVGSNLFDSNAKRDWLLVHSYFNYGVVTDNRIIATYPSGQHEVLDLENKRLPEEKMPADIGFQVLEAISRFYR